MNLWGIAGTAVDDLLVAGASSQAWRWDGQQWSPTANTGIKFAVFGLARADGPHIFAVGAGGKAACFNGVSGSSVQTPTLLALLGVHGLPSGQVFAVGHGGAVVRYEP